ncbi:terminase small subunit, partial [Streptococcus danieliae]|nr:terminase small subunit [Streptococcus danieliae]
QQRFADEYIISGNAYQSAIKAGYSEKYAKTDSHKLLENTRIKKYVNERLDELQSATIASQEEVLEYLSSVMRGEQREQTLISVGEAGQEIVDIDVGAKDRIRAGTELL